MYQYKATITRIIDGDTVDCDIDLGFKVILFKQRIRLYGIDTPESRTRDKVEKKYGLLAKKFLVDFIEAEDYQITLETAKESGRGKFGRILGKIINKHGQCVNDLMCQVGHAVPYHGQSKEDIAAEHIQNRERVKKISDNTLVG
jgi:micrococcal nuclease